MNIIEINKERDVFLTDEENVFFIPREWCYAWSYAQGHTGGLDWTPEHSDMADGPEVYCYAPTGIGANSDVETLFVLVSSLEKMREVSETEAQQIHPKLFETLENINSNQY